MERAVRATGKRGGESKGRAVGTEGTAGRWRDVLKIYNEFESGQTRRAERRVIAGEAERCGDEAASAYTIITLGLVLDHSVGPGITRRSFNFEKLSSRLYRVLGFILSYPFSPTYPPQPPFPAHPPHFFSLSP